MIRNFLCLLCLLALASCGGREASPADRGKAKGEAVSDSRDGVESPAVFIPALAPASMSKQQQTQYLREHYWDKFDFADTLLLSRIDKERMTTAFAVYVGAYVPDSLAYRYLPRLMHRASESKRMYTYFLDLAEVVLHDPNSPLRSDEKYIPVLESAVQSKWLDEYERMPYEWDLTLARKNRVGRQANDFTYTLRSGAQHRMYDIEADFLLLFFSNPECEMCQQLREQISSSPMLTQLQERGELRVLVVYPDEDLQSWREHLKDYPQSWICAYDKQQSLLKQSLYDMKAIPALYLLDSQKRVMAKDCTDVEYIEKLLSE